MVWYIECSWRKNVGKLVYPLLVAQTMWFRMPNFCSTIDELVEHGIEDHKACNRSNVQVGFREVPMLHIKLSLSKGGPLLRCEVDWDRVTHWLQRCQWVLLTKFVGGRT